MVALKKRPGGELPTRPLHFIWIADCSYSMEGSKIQGLNHAIREAIPAMQNVAADNVNAEVLVRAVKFSDGAKWHVAEATPVEDFKWQDLHCGAWNRDMGAALRLVADQLKMLPMTERGLPPVLVLISDGQPTDDFESGLKELMAVPWGKKAVRIGIAIGEDADMEVLQQFIGNKELQPLHAHNAEQLVKYIRWHLSIDAPVIEESHTRNQLRFIIENYGRSIIDYPRRCRGMLKDLAPKHQRETNLLMLALEQKLVAALIEKTHTPILMHLDILAQRLHNNIGIQKDFAVWAIESWALALDVIQTPLAHKIIMPESAVAPNYDEVWQDELIAWADEHDISDYYFDDRYECWLGFPRDKQVILKMTELTLWATQFSKCPLIPESIGKLTNLTKLYLSGNCIELALGQNTFSFPESIDIYKLTNLTHLSLIENELTEIPNFISNLTNLTMLDLRRNRIEAFPDFIGNLTNLGGGLYLSDNLIKSLPSLSNLKTLPQNKLKKRSCTSLWSLPTTLVYVPNSQSKPNAIQQ